MTFNLSKKKKKFITLQPSAKNGGNFLKEYMASLQISLWFINACQNNVFFYFILWCHGKKISNSETEKTNHYQENPYNVYFVKWINPFGITQQSFQVKTTI